MKTVTILRGLPGSGKSHYARTYHSDAVVCSADHFFEKDGQYQFDPAKLPQAHAACLNKFIEAVLSGKRSIVVDNTNLSLWEASPYHTIATANGYRVELRWFRTELPVCLARQTHGVPEHVMKEMLSRYEEPLPWWVQYVTSDDGETFWGPG